MPFNNWLNVISNATAKISIDRKHGSTLPFSTAEIYDRPSPVTATSSFCPHSRFNRSLRIFTPNLTHTAEFPRSSVLVIRRNIVSLIAKPLRCLSATSNRMVNNLNPPSDTLVIHECKSLLSSESLKRILSSTWGLGVAGRIC